MKKTIFVIIVALLLLIACDNPVNNPVNKTDGFYPPSWVKGTWVSEDETTKLIITNDNIVLGMNSEPMSFSIDYKAMFTSMGINITDQTSSSNSWIISLQKGEDKSKLVFTKTSSGLVMKTVSTEGEEETNFHKI